MGYFIMVLCSSININNMRQFIGEVVKGEHKCPFLLVQNMFLNGIIIMLSQTDSLLILTKLSVLFNQNILINFGIVRAIGLITICLFFHACSVDSNVKQYFSWIIYLIIASYSILSIRIFYQIINKMISQIFILSSRGDTIINRDYRSDLIKNTPELFFRQVKLSKGDCEPVFNIEGINFAYLNIASLYFVGTTRFNVSPSFALELLYRIVVVIRDFCGVISEEVVRKNFVLVYQILDQIIDFGHPQLTNTSHIKPLIASEVVQAKSGGLDMKKIGNFLSFNQTASSNASNVSVSKNQSNEIFVDIYEKINMIFNASGYVINSSIDGCIQMKSYLTGNPALKLILNEDIAMAETNSNGHVILDDCNFHQSVNYSQFIMNKSLRIDPPEGQFVVMNYRITSDFSAPFKVFAFFETVNQYKVELTIKLKSMFPKKLAASFVLVKFNVPKKVSGINPQIINNQGNQRSEYIESSNTVEWTIKKMPGQSQYTLLTKITLPQASTINAQRQTGPISLNFEIPMYNISDFAIKSLKILQGDENPVKWVRYITKSSSYVCRI